MLFLLLFCQNELGTDENRHFMTSVYCLHFRLYIEDLTRMVISYEIYETSLWLVS